jgi:1A family penicillin-binding protein
MKKRKILKTIAKDLLILSIGLGFLFSGFVILWIASFKIPTLESFEERKITQSTKIYDRTGEILLYDVFQDVKRTVVSFEDISDNLKNATVAIEDKDFYEHNGIKPTSIARAILANLTSISYSQGGSTITQQVVKLTLLTNEKLVSRKLKEWVLALKLEQEINKDTILNFYLNEIPYGGTLYGAEEAANAFFGKTAKDLTIAEAAHMAALPQAPTYYSPYGKNTEALETRKNLVLSNMRDLNYISEEEYESAKEEVVIFLDRPELGIKAPHFVFFVRDYLEGKYGEGILETGGLKVITTLDLEKQKIAEDVVKEYAFQNEEKFDSENAALVAIDPKTGQILTMVGSRDYFDKEIDGNFNVSTVDNRQPGSTFKPFVYAEAFRKGYSPETVLFDAETVFSTDCSPDPIISEEDDHCYIPGNYDYKFRGPMTMREALAQSINIPAIKSIYLAGVSDVLNLASKLGIKNLGDSNQYGLTLALGGGEISLLEMVNAYSVFANDGDRNEYTGILEIYDKNGDTLEEFEISSKTVIEKEVARMVSDVLSDNVARAPSYGSHSLLHFPGKDVAVKTGTTNDYRDAWIIGYTPTIAVGAWAGNNDNRPMDKKVAGQIIAPLWNAFMSEIINDIEDEKFTSPLPQNTQELKPVMRGEWKGGFVTYVDKFSGLLANENTPPEARNEILTGGIHNILYWVDKNNPLGPNPVEPQNDSQFESWEFAVQKWIVDNNIATSTVALPTETSQVHNQNSITEVSLITPSQDVVYNKNQVIDVNIKTQSIHPVSKVEFYINNQFIGSDIYPPFNFRFVPINIDNINQINYLNIIVTDSVFNKKESEFLFEVDVN